MKKRLYSIISVILCLVMIINVGKANDAQDNAYKSVEIASIGDYIPDEILEDVDGVIDDNREFVEIEESEINYEGEIVSSNKTKAEKKDNRDASTLMDTILESTFENDNEDDNISDNNGNVTVKSPADDSKDKGEVPFDISNPDEFENGDIEYTSNTILVKLPKSYGQTLTRELYDAGIGKIDVMFSTEDCTWFTAYLLKDKDVNETMGKVRELDSVVVAEYNFVYETTSATIDEIYVSNPRAKDQWVLKSCSVEGAWEALENKGIEAGGSRNVTVAVIDTGVDYTHKDLASNIWINKGEIPDNGVDDDNNGYIDDYYGVDITAKGAGGGSAMDDEGHGTHVAGIIAAANNNEGVVGLAYNTQIMAIKSGDGAGIFTQGNIAAGIIYAFNNGADVINMSFGGLASSIAVQDALSAAYTRCVLVASAGNEGASNLILPVYPAAFPQVLGVMSVDSSMVESRFTNYDIYLYSSREYEVYAPGEQILSTLPGDIYGALSGTSMAAPIVAAQAALLRSYYSDRSTYPTKFIYGQIVGTADDVVICEMKHGTHNVPGCVNFARSIGEYPVPDLGITDVTIFDSENYPADTQSLTSGKTSKNNGDGVIDAGELLSVGFTIKNRWGKSMNSVVHLEAVSETSGVESPYVEILNNDTDYGSVGTYSETDCGKIMDGDRWTGWEKPFYVKIADNCPNDYTIRFQMTVSYKNGLDDKDTSEYLSDICSMYLTVRRGTILPRLIKEDTTLTKDNYYILPNSMRVVSGATLTIEEGTQIQFWTNDAMDPLAETGVASIKVDGNLICNGTKDEPIKMFPSGLFDSYPVVIEADYGYAELRYVDVTNPILNIDNIYDCTLRQNYYGCYFNKMVSAGGVSYYSVYGQLEATNIERCRFYKLGGAYYSQSNDNRFTCKGKLYKACIFVDSAINHEGDYYEECVFYGNSIFEMGTYKEGTSTYLPRDVSDVLNIKESFILPEENKAYFAIETGERSVYNFMKSLGGDYAIVKSKNELAFITGHVSSFKCGLSRNPITKEILGADNQPIPEGIEVPSLSEEEWVRVGSIGYRDEHVAALSGGSDYLYTMFEIICPDYITNIELDKYSITIDDECSYQLKPRVTPADMDIACLVYSSEDDSVATVDSNGLISARGVGSTRIKIYSPDMAIYNYVTVNVINKIDITNMDVQVDTADLEVGAVRQIKLTVTPENSTKKEVNYISSDETVAKVGNSGRIYAIAPGKVTISVVVSGHEEFTKVIELNVVLTARELIFEEDIYHTSLTKDDKYDFYPVLKPDNSTIKDIEWSSINPDICYVNEQGELVKLAKGSTTLIAKIKGTDITDSIHVVISETGGEGKLVNVKSYGNRHYALKDGVLYQWGDTDRYPRKAGIDEKLKAFDVNYYGIAGVDESGTVKYWRSLDSKNTLSLDSSLSQVKNIESVSACDNNIYAITKNGTIYCYGSNQYGQMGNGTFTNNNDFDAMDTEFNATKIVALYSAALILDDHENVYIVGGYYIKSTEPQLIATGVKDISFMNGYIHNAILEFEHEYKSVDTSVSDIDLIYSGGIQVEKDRDYIVAASNVYYIENGILYGKGNNSYGNLGIKGKNSVDSFVKIGDFNNVRSVYGTSTLFIMTDTDELYALGSGFLYALGNGQTGDSHIPVKINFGMTEVEDSLSIESCNVIEEDGGNRLDEYVISVGFSREIEIGSHYAEINLVCTTDDDSKKLPLIKTSDLNKANIEPREGWEIGKEYKLTIPTGAYVTFLGTECEAKSIVFTYNGPAEKPVETVPEVPDEEPDGEKQDVVTDEDLLAQRVKLCTKEEVLALWDEYVGKGYNTVFRSNVIINRLNDDDLTHWLRISGRESGTYTEIAIGGNYWGTTDSELIKKQLFDYDLYQSLADLNEGEYLTEAPSNTFPFVVDAYLTIDNSRTDTVGNDLVTFVVEFNREMKTDIPLRVRFGSAYPYGDYEIEGAYDVDNAKIWRGTVQLNTLIENGYQCWSISNGCAAGTDMELYEDWGRFPFMIDTSSAQALTMQANAELDGIHLSWTQDDFDTLAGYNVYRAVIEDGVYTKLNKTVIPADTKTWVDDTVEPGQKYYYNFTVVQSDMKESEPSGKISITSLDLMAPNIYHSPVVNAFVGTNMVVSATISDNVAVQGAKLIYRITGTEEWKTLDMDHFNDKYSAVIPGENVTLAGIEYYIEAYDGVSYTYRGSSTEPISVIVQEYVSDSSLGDVDGNGTIDMKDVMMILMAINDRLNLSVEEFNRADIDGNGELTAREALRVMMYINGAVGSVKY